MQPLVGCLVERAVQGQHRLADPVPAIVALNRVTPFDSQTPTYRSMLEDRPDRVSDGFGVVPDENVPAVLGGQPFEPTDVLTTASSRRTREPATAAHGSCGSSAPNPADRAASSIRRVGEAVRSP